MPVKSLARGQSCGPQSFRGDEPTEHWGLEELGSYAQRQHRHIVQKERRLTPAYWRLGHSLVLAKKNLNHGQWAKFLEELGIEKTRASKSRAIYRAFPSAQSVAILSVEEAYHQRRRSQGEASPTSSKGTIAQKQFGQLQKSLDKIATRTGEVVHEAGFVEPSQAVLLIPAVRQAIAELQQLLQSLEEQSAAVRSSDAALQTVAGQPTS